MQNYCHPRYTETALYFNNPLWLHLQLSDASLLTFDEQQAPLIEKESNTASYEVNEAGSIVPLAKGITILPEDESLPKEDAITNNDEKVEHIDEGHQNEKLITNTEPASETIFTENEIAESKHDDPSNEIQEESEIKETDVATELIEDENNSAARNDKSLNVENGLSELQSANEFADVHATDEDVALENETIFTQEDEQVAEVSASNDEENIFDSPEAAVAPDPFHPEKEEVLEEIEQEKSESEITSNAIEHVEEKHPIVLPVHEEDSKIIDEFVEAQQHPVNEVTPDVPAVNTTSPEPVIPIEPYYTVDYFASQGIRFTPEMHPQDKLGKQLKSFTQWLKVMKKIGPEDAVKPNEDSVGDPKIVGIAEKSNKKEEVVTEAMAGVLEQQGKTQQAISVYQKLSFLNPDKSAYFADKIQKLKGI